MKSVVKIAIFVFMLLAIPSATKACDAKPYAKSYVDQIHAVVSGKKPNLIVEKGTNASRYAFYENGTIHIYSGDYQGACGQSTSFLKSVVAHEYGHHLESRLAPVAKARGERLGFIAEHAIADEILGNAVYDNVLSSKDASAYASVKTMIQSAKAKQYAGTKSAVTYLKAKKS